MVTPAQGRRGDCFVAGANRLAAASSWLTRGIGESKNRGDTAA